MSRLILSALGIYAIRRSEKLLLNGAGTKHKVCYCVIEIASYPLLLKDAFKRQTTGPGSINRSQFICQEILGLQTRFQF
jgi:hypothetical protein